MKYKKVFNFKPLTRFMSHNPFRKSKKELVPGTIVKCQSGRYIAYYEHRTDIIANGENEKDAKKNLKEMYDVVIKFETKEEEEKNTIKLPSNFEIKKFKDKISCH